MSRLALEAGPHLPDEEFRLLRDLVNYYQYYQCVYHPDARHGARERGRGADHQRDLLLPRGVPAARVPRRDPARSSEGPRRGARHEDAGAVERGLLERRGGLHARHPHRGLGLFKGWDVRIYGNDISRRVLHKARTRRLHRGRASAPPTTATSLLRGRPRGDARCTRASAPCATSVTSTSCITAARPSWAVDAVFCRNVLIYFDPDIPPKAIDTFYHRLVAGGTSCWDTASRCSTLAPRSSWCTCRPISSIDVPPRMLFRTPSVFEGS
jgi:hypothetical protein